MPIPAEISTCHLPQGHFATSITAWRDCESPGKVVWVSIVKALDPGGLPGHFFPKAQRPEGQLDAENLHLLGRPRDCQLVRSTSCWPARPSGQWPPVAMLLTGYNASTCFNFLALLPFLFLHRLRISALRWFLYVNCQMISVLWSLWWFIIPHEKPALSGPERTVSPAPGAMRWHLTGVGSSHYRAP